MFLIDRIDEEINKKEEVLNLSTSKIKSVDLTQRHMHIVCRRPASFSCHCPSDLYFEL